MEKLSDIMDVDKKELRKRFAQEWEKHYKLEALISRGFKRQKCKKCGKNFWSVKERDLCADASCIGFQFVGNTPVQDRLGYIETWKKIENYFTENNHTYIKPYPTVARWRDDLYFTIASINDFQPYVVNGELDPPANPLIVPQPCIRFPDIQNVGVTGSHYTNFVMIGQHAFNNERTGLFYWKEEAINHDINYLNRLGIPLEEIVFQEDVWAGGGNFGPSMEYFVRGLELGNCVFMQYEITPSGARELRTKVIDMGAGLSRLAWITSGDPTSYEVVFGDVVEIMKKNAGIKTDKQLLTKFTRLAGSLNIDEVEDIEAAKETVAKELGMEKKELFEKLEPLQAIYASADHLLTILFTTTDGMLPSNAGGGYNLRMILRRTFGFNDRYHLNFDYEKIIEGHAAYLEPIFPHLKDGTETTIDVIEEERKKYESTKEKARVIVANIIRKAKGNDKTAKKESAYEAKNKISVNDLVLLYKSHGVPPDYVIEIAKENDVEAQMPGNFYELVREGEGGSKVEEEKKKVLDLDVIGYPKTEVLYYSDISEFEAEIIDITKNGYAVLNKTAFYPEGGGQVADKGWIEGIEVTDVIKKHGVVLHKVAEPNRLKKGKVRCKVDTARRKRITTHHTCAHLLNAAAREVLGEHIWQAGSYKDEEKGHLDITHYKKITQDELDEIEKKVNEYIRQNLPIKVEVLPRNVAEQRYGFRLYQGGAVPGKELRIVSIGDIDHEACGGTHHMLKSTGEIGVYKIIKRESIQDGVERITYKAGDVAIKYIQEREKMIKRTAAIVSVGENEIESTMKRFFEEWKMQKNIIENLSTRLAAVESQQIAEEYAKTKKPIFRLTDLDVEVLKKIAITLSAENKDISFCILNKKGDIVCASGENSLYSAEEIMKKVIEKLGGKGGGSRRIAFGKVSKIGIVEF
ncbi:MAG: alanine--tRNA ligase [Candidatus Bilamarchaeaceae archaeon]